MDAAARAELDELRRRAYGPDPDLDRDGLDRLIDLEELVLRERLAGAADAAPEASGTRHPAPPDASSAGPPRSPRRRFALLVGVGAASVIAALGVVALLRALAPTETASDAGATLPPTTRESRDAYSFALDTDAVTLLQIPLDGSFGNYIDLPATGHVPEFPAKGEVEWASNLGEYFGWDVWIAGAGGISAGMPREHCIMVEHGAVSRGRCVAAELRSQSALLVAVPFRFVAREERPVGMAPDDRLGFWWYHDRAVTVLLGDDPAR